MTEKKKRISKIVKKYRGEKSLRDFSDELTNGLDTVTISYQSVFHWEHGEYMPKVNTLLTLISQTDDWRRKFAGELLKIVDDFVYSKINVQAYELR